jgi:hypothetical protein
MELDREARKRSAQSEVAAFISARLNEDEQPARTATGGPWRVDSEDYAEAILSTADPSVTVVGGSRWGGEASVFESTEDAVHIARHHPARVLAEVEAKRSIVIWHRAVQTDRFIHPDGSSAGTLEVCHTCDANSTDADWPDFPCLTLCYLALPYASHPDYREEWRP